MFQNSFVSLKDMTKGTILPQFVLQIWKNGDHFSFFLSHQGEPHVTINTDPIRDPWVWLLSIDLPSPDSEETLQAHQLLRHSSNPLDQAVAAEGSTLAFLPFLPILAERFIIAVIAGYCARGRFISSVYWNQASCEGTAKQLLASSTIPFCIHYMS